MAGTFVGTLHLVGMEWVPGKPPAVYMVHCTCNYDFPCNANWRGMVECPICGARESFRLLWKAWHGIPHKMMLGRFRNSMKTLEKSICH